MTYRLIQDDDFHWYIVPADKYDTAEEYFNETANYWAIENSLSWKTTDPPNMPSFLVRIDSPTHIEFDDYRVL